MPTIELRAATANTIIRHKEKYYRVTAEGKAIDANGVYALVSPDTEVDIVKTAEDLASDYLKIASPLNELGSAIKEIGNTFVQQLQQATAEYAKKADAAKANAASGEKPTEEDTLEAAEAKPDEPTPRTK